MFRESLAMDWREVGSEPVYRLEAHTLLEEETELGLEMLLELFSKQMGRVPRIVH